MTRQTNNDFFESHASRYARWSKTRWFSRMRTKIMATIPFEREQTFSLLDLSCGSGDLLAEIKKTYPSATLFGIDASEKLKDIAKQNARTAEIIVGDAHALPYRDNNFDIITCALAFHHYHDASQAAQEIFRVLKPNGELVVFDLAPETTSMQKLWNFFGSRVERGAHHFFSGDELGKLLFSCGFENIQTKKSGFFIPGKLLTAFKPSDLSQTQ